MGYYEDSSRAVRCYERRDLRALGILGCVAGGGKDIGGRCGVLYRGFGLIYSDNLETMWAFGGELRCRNNV